MIILVIISLVLQLTFVQCISEIQGSHHLEKRDETATNAPGSCDFYDGDLHCVDATNCRLFAGFLWLCDCIAGYSYTSLSIDTGSVDVCLDQNECDPQTECESAHTCTNLPGTFECGCNAGWLLDSNVDVCEEVNECDTGQHNCEQICNNTIGGFECQCNDGFILQPDGSCSKALDLANGIKICHKYYAFTDDGGITKDDAETNCANDGTSLAVVKNELTGTFLDLNLPGLSDYWVESQCPTPAVGLGRRSAMKTGYICQ